MQMGNLVVQTGLEVKDICFTSTEYAQLWNMVNVAREQALHAGLIIGAIAATVGIFGAILLLKWKKDKDWLDYGKG